MGATQARVVTTDREIDDAIERAKAYDAIRPRAISAAYLPKDDAVMIVLATGVTLTIPRTVLQGLENATLGDLTAVDIEDFGSSLRWNTLDVDHYVPALIDGIFGSRKWMSEAGKRGGASRSEAKRAAAKENGRKGGRPKLVR